MGAIITFDLSAWRARYPEFNAVPDASVKGYFAEATIYCRNDGGGPVPTADMLATLLNMLTAHIAKLYSTASGGAAPANTPVGQISNATEGSVSVGYTNQYPPGTAQWYQQSKYGASYWAATSIFRRARYLPGCGIALAAPASFQYPNP